MSKAAMTVHYMQYGMTACQKPGPPVKWPEPDHRWSPDWNDVNCPECLKGRDYLEETFVITKEGDGIKCKRCGYTSFEPSDVKLHLCPVCQASHDDLWPPARRWWVEHPDPPQQVERRVRILAGQNYPGFGKRGL